MINLVSTLKKGNKQTRRGGEPAASWCPADGCTQKAPKAARETATAAVGVGAVVEQSKRGVGVEQPMPSLLVWPSSAEKSLCWRRDSTRSPKQLKMEKINLLKTKTWF